MSRNCSGGLLVGDANLSREQALDAGDDHLHPHFVFVRADQRQVLGSRHAAGQHLGILQQFVGAFALHRQRVDPATFKKPSRAPG